MWTTEPEGKDGPGRRQAGRFVQSGRTTFFPVPVLWTSTSGRTVSFNGRLHAVHMLERAGEPAETVIVTRGQPPWGMGGTDQHQARGQINTRSAGIGPAKRKPSASRG